MLSRKMIQAVSICLLEELGYETTVRLLHKLKGITGSTSFGKTIEALREKVDDLNTTSTG